jgi:hypothetical protein
MAKCRHLGEMQDFLHGEKAKVFGDFDAIKVQKSPEVFVGALGGDRPILRS